MPAPCTASVASRRWNVSQPFFGQVDVGGRGRDGRAGRPPRRWVRRSSTHRRRPGRPRRRRRPGRRASWTRPGAWSGEPCESSGWNLIWQSGLASLNWLMASSAPFLIGSPRPACVAGQRLEAGDREVLAGARPPPAAVVAAPPAAVVAAPAAVVAAPAAVVAAPLLSSSSSPHAAASKARPAAMAPTRTRFLRIWVVLPLLTGWFGARVGTPETRSLALLEQGAFHRRGPSKQILSRDGHALVTRRRRAPNLRPWPKSSTKSPTTSRPSRSTPPNG